MRAEEEREVARRLAAQRGQEAEEAGTRADQERQSREAEAAAKRGQQRWTMLAEASSSMRSADYESALARLLEATAIRHDHAARLAFGLLATLYPHHPTSIWRTPGEPTCVAFSPDGSIVASGGGSTIILWDAGTGQQLRTLRGATTRPQQASQVEYRDGSRSDQVLTTGGPTVNIQIVENVISGAECS